MKDIIINTVAGLFCTVCSNAQNKSASIPLENVTKYECTYFSKTYELTRDYIMYHRPGTEYDKEEFEKYDMPAECYEYFLRRLKEGNVSYDKKGGEIDERDFYRFGLKAYKGKKLIFSAEGNDKQKGTCRYEGTMPPRIFDAVLDLCGNRDDPKAPTGKIKRYEFMRAAWELPTPHKKFIVERDGDKCKVTLIAPHYKIYEDKTFTCSATLLDEIDKVVHDHLMYRYKRNYQPKVQVLDGEHWNLEIKYENGSIYSSGSNASFADNGDDIIHDIILKYVGLENEVK